MRKLVLLLIAVFGLIINGSGFVFANENTYGAEGALADQDLTLEEMLTYGIQDEYIAEAEYQSIINNYGSVKPFTNIIKAEKQHINALEELFLALGFSIPINDFEERVVLPSSLQESYQTGVIAEINNIAMYEKFLNEELPENVRIVFEALKAASENHLNAFQKNLNRVTNR